LIDAKKDTADGAYFMAERKKLPLGTQDFETLKKNSEFYLDKTPQLYSLLEHSGRYNFLSRPRCFVKI